MPYFSRVCLGLSALLFMMPVFSTQSVALTINDQTTKKGLIFSAFTPSSYGDTIFPALGTLVGFVMIPFPKMPSDYTVQVLVSSKSNPSKTCTFSVGLDSSGQLICKTSDCAFGPYQVKQPSAYHCFFNMIG